MSFRFTPQNVDSANTACRAEPICVKQSEKLKAEDPAFEATVRSTLMREPFEVSRNAELVKTVTTEVEHVLGEKQQHVGEIEGCHGVS